MDFLLAATAPLKAHKIQLKGKVLKTMQRGGIEEICPPGERRIFKQ